MELYKCDGRRKKIMDINALVPCRKCSWPEQIDSAFTDLVRFLGSSREEMETSLGTGTYSKSYYLTDFFVRSIGGKRIIGFEYIPKRPIEMIYEKIVNERFLKSIGIKV